MPLALVTLGTGPPISQRHSPQLAEHERDGSWIHAACLLVVVGCTAFVYTSSRRRHRQLQPCRGPVRRDLAMVSQVVCSACSVRVQLIGCIDWTHPRLRFGHSVQHLHKGTCSWHRRGPWGRCCLFLYSCSRDYRHSLEPEWQCACRRVHQCN